MSSEDAALAVLRAACSAASATFSVGDHVRAAVAGVAVLEDDPQFNAGYGSVLTADGDVEVDAAVVDGAAGRYGGVAAARDIRHPAQVAEQVLRRADAVLLSGKGAEDFAVAQGVRLEDLRTPEQLSVWEALRSGQPLSPFTGRIAAPSTETVGCMAARGGAVAAASSTGGVCGKASGRIGDSAILGAGLWADHRSAVLCSGEGEAMISLQLARRVAERIAGGEPADAATRWAVRLAADEKGAVAAVLALDLTDLTIGAAHSGTSFPVVASDGHTDRVIESHRIEVAFR